MKKLSVLLLLLLCACSTNKTVLIDRNESVEISDDVFTCASETVAQDDAEYQIAAGIRINRICENGMEMTDAVLYPVFQEDDLKVLLLWKEEPIWLSDPAILSLLMEDDSDSEFVFIGEDLYLIGNERILLISGTEKQWDRTEKEIVMKLQRSKIVGNDWKLKKRLLKKRADTITDDDGITYSASRIVVTFTEGDTEDKIALFEEFCQGTLRVHLQNTDVCVFEIPQLDMEGMKQLLAKARELDYVTAAEADRQNELNTGTGTVSY